MSILRRDPLGEFVSLRDAMNRLMEESVVHSMGEMGVRFPAIDMTETDDNVIVKAELAGVKLEDLDITVEANTLTIRGEMKEEREGQEEGKRIYQERRYGAFSRSFTLPTAIEAEEANADYEDGILTLTLPKAETAKRKSIEIKSK